MIPLDSFTLAAVMSELRRLLIGARVQRIYQPSAADIVLSLFESTSGPQRLLLSADPRTYRAHLTQVRRENPKIAPNFCMICRKDLEGAWISAIDMPRFDRVLRITFRAPEGGALFLFAELMGRNSNLVLVSGTGLIRAVIRPTQGGTRVLRAGAHYEDPPGYYDRRDLFTLTPDSPPPTGDIATEFAGIGKFAASEIEARAGSNSTPWQALQALLADIHAEAFEPHTIGSADGTTLGVWAFEPLSVAPGLRFPRESISVALDTFYATLLAGETESGERTTLARTIAKEKAYRVRELESARRTIAEADRADEYEQRGNLILANLHAIPRGSETATVVNYYAEDAPQITLSLDPAKSPHENAEREFERARKARDAREYADGRAADLRDELRTLSDLERDLERAEEPSALAAIRAELVELAGAERVGNVGAGKDAESSRKRRPKDAKDKPFGGNRVGTYKLGEWVLYVGETAQSNDYLLTRVAAPSDIWMHVRSGTGAHGVLRTNKQPDKVPDAILRRAAEIVAFRSGSVKHSSVVAVDVTERRYVRKPRGVKAGLAVYTQARTLDVTPRLSA